MHSKRTPPATLRKTKTSLTPHPPKFHTRPTYTYLGFSLVAVLNDLGDFWRFLMILATFDYFSPHPKCGVLVFRQHPPTPHLTPPSLHTTPHITHPTSHNLSVGFPPSTPHLTSHTPPHTTPHHLTSHPVEDRGSGLFWKAICSGPCRGSRPSWHSIA